MMATAQNEPTPSETTADDPRVALAVDDLEILRALVETSRQPLVVQFRSATQRAGKLISPELDTLARSAGTWLTVVDACTTTDPQMLDHFHLVATPAVVIFSDGHEIARTDGNQKAKELERFTATALEFSGLPETLELPAIDEE